VYNHASKASGCGTKGARQGRYRLERGKRRKITLKYSIIAADAVPNLAAQPGQMPTAPGGGDLHGPIESMDELVPTMTEKVIAVIF
jgi:hypothetical protein